jgi:hypothetical protein
MKVFWGDTHHNTYTRGAQDPPMAAVLSFAATYLDFYTGAYYTPVADDVPVLPGRVLDAFPGMSGHPAELAALPADGWKGIRAERTKDALTIEREWNELQEATAACNSPGRFVAFPGYEWQGDGTWGDCNVICRHEGLSVHVVRTLPELYARLRGTEALAIPHHTAYQPGLRAPRWESCDDSVSPFAEIHSIHGCSETDEEWIGLRSNSHMGPGVGGGTYQAALDRGLRLGAICSSDNWTNMPGCWGQGVMACLAPELTRDALWQAFRRRRVYGVTGDRMELDFTCNGQPMGSVMEDTERRDLEVVVRGQDAIDRIEILRNGRVIATHCHQGTWDGSSGPTRYKLRLEFGWGPRLGELPFVERHWSVEAVLSRGRFVGWSPCWITRGQEVPRLEGATARFTMSSSQTTVDARAQNAVVLELEADPAAELAVRVNGKTLRERVHALERASSILWYREECLDLVQEATGIVSSALERQDPLFYHYAFKAKVHRLIPEAGYCARLSFTDTDKLEGPAHYRVRVEQRNGQRAWSSPIWIEAGVAGRTAR